MTKPISIHQGDSFAIPVVLTQDGLALSADLVREIQLTVGGILNRSLTDGTLLTTEKPGHYAFVPTQTETLAMTPGTYDVAVRVRYRDATGWVNVEPIGRLTILEAPFREEI